MRRKLLGVAAVVAVAIALTGCSSNASSSTSSKPVTINVLSTFTPDVSRGKVLDKLIAEFNKANKGKYTVVSKSQPDWPTLQQQIRNDISASSAPDVFLYNYNPTDLSREKSGQLMDWSKYLNTDPAWKSRYLASTLKQLTVGGKLVALPGDQSPAVFYYNEDLFKAAGITSFPKTWDSFMSDSVKLQKTGVSSIALMTTDDAWYTMNAFSYLATAAGGPNAFAVGKSLNNSAVVTAATDLKKLFIYAPKDALGGNYAAASADFLSGHAATVIDGPWLISSIQSQMKNTTVGVAAAPTNGDGKIQAGSVVTDSLNAWGAAKQSDPKKTASVVAWMKFFMSNSSASQMAINGQYPMKIKTSVSGSLASQAPEQMKQLLAVSNAAPNATVNLERYLTTGAQSKLPSLLEALILGQTTPKQFAASLQADNK
jgi:raffinose/stachyose/melibiose transport system substrate-binding protein